MADLNDHNAESIREALEKLAENGLPPADADLAKVFDVGTGPFIRFFEDEVLGRIVMSGGATLKFFEGSHGSGKTHITRLLEQSAFSQGCAVVRIDLSQGLSLRYWKSITQTVLETIALSIGSEFVIGLPNILEKLRESNSLRLDRFKRSNLAHPGFRTAMLQVLESRNLNPQADDLLESFLLGERVTVRSFKAAGIRGVKNPLTERNAEQVLKTILGGLHLLGIPGTLIIFDENEATFDFTGRKGAWVQTSANKLRRLIDACFTGGLVGTIVVFAVLPGFLERCNTAYPALGERLRMDRSGTFSSSWRWPVLSVDDVGNTATPEDFLKEETKIMIDLVEGLSGDSNGLEDQMIDQGSKVLQNNAGSGYKREIMKSLAASAIARL